MPGRSRGLRRGRDAGLLAAAAFLPAVVAAVLAAAPVAPPATAGAAAPAPDAWMERARFLMGTRLVIEAVGEAEGRDVGGAVEQAFAEVERLEQVLSNWRPESEICRLNRNAAEGPVVCSPDLFAAVALSLFWAERTGGAFDPTVEPLVRRLGIRGDEGRLPGVPAESRPGRGPDPVGWRLVEALPGPRTVRFRARGAGLDFGGIGKGIALDAAAAVLRRAGVASARLDFGGQALVFGQGPDDGGWNLGVADPLDRQRIAGTFVLRSGSMATSGDSERSRHHVDPRTGAPPTFDGSLTVLAPEGASADALSTALFVMGPERGIDYAASQGLDVLYLRRDGDGSLRRIGRGAFDSFVPASPAVTSRQAAEAGAHP